MKIETTHKADWSFSDITLMEPKEQVLTNVKLGLLPRQNIVITQSKAGLIDISVSDISTEACIAKNSNCALLSGETVDGEQTFEYMPPNFRFAIDTSDKINDNNVVSVNAYNGIVTFGRGYSDKSDREFSPLLSGEIILYGRHSFAPQDGHYSTPAVQLAYGDVITIGGDSDETKGIVTFGESKLGMLVSATSDAPVAKIYRYSTQGVEIRNGILSRVYNDYGLGSLWTLVVLAMQLIFYYYSRNLKNAH